MNDNRTVREPSVIVPPDHEWFPLSEVEQSLVARFAAMVGRHGGRVAVRSAGATLTYRELNARANTIAHALLDSRGHGPEPVALALGQGATLVAAILGVLKAGRFYVPLDAVLPDDVNRARLAHCEAAIVVASAASLDWARRIAPDHRILVVQALDRPRPDDPSVATGPSDLAYIYYTSGSTGAPKGVCDTHRNVLHNVLRYTNGYGLAPSDRLSLLQSPGFSGAVSNVFGALCNGAAVCPFDVRAGGDPATWIAQQAITVYHSVPVLLRLLADANAVLETVRLVRLEGDRATRRDLDVFLRRFGPDCVLANGLGATETGLVCRYLFGHGDPLPDGDVPVGYPTADVEVLVLDEAGEACCPGTIGQIAVQGRYLACGYWRDPERTRQQFLEIEQAPGVRRYLTGDRGRLRSDGCVEYLGRIGPDARLQGQFIDLARVEAALQSAPGVREAAATVREAPDGRAMLVAYVVSPESPMDEDRLRRTLAGRLSGIEMPSRFVLLERLPLNANLKVDRNALPPPPARGDAASRSGAPASEEEREVAELWEEVLDRPSVGIHDRWLDLGGDSLQATRLVSRLLELGISLTVGELLDEATVASLATRLRGSR